jgi:hypothetical protein
MEEFLLIVTVKKTLFYIVLVHHRTVQVMCSQCEMESGLEVAQGEHFLTNEIPLCCVGRSNVYFNCPTGPVNADTSSVHIGL